MATGSQHLISGSTSSRISSTVERAGKSVTSPEVRASRVQFRNALPRDASDSKSNRMELSTIRRVRFRLCQRRNRNSVFIPNERETRIRIRVSRGQKLAVAQRNARMRNETISVGLSQVQSGVVDNCVDK